MTEQDEIVRRLLQRGVPKMRIASQLGTSRDQVDRIAARVGFPARKRGPDRHDWSEVRTYYEEGHSGAACQRHFEFSAATWEAAIARGEIVPRPRASQQPPGETRREVEHLLNEGIGYAEIAERLGISKPTVSYHARKLGVPPQTKFARRFDWDAIRAAYESGVSRRECQRRFGCSSESWRAAVERGDIVPRSHLIPIEELLVKGRHTSRGHLKKRLIDAGLKQNRCEECGITEWRDRPLNMELHHVNGDKTDNRLPNLRFLCGNCHALTHSWGGRNAGRKRRDHLRLVEPPDEDAA